MLVWLLRKFLYRPVREVIEKRKKLSEQAFADADRQKNADNLLTAESLALVLRRFAQDATNDALGDAARSVMLLESDASRGDHYYKGGTLTSEPQVRIESGWWDDQGTACIYVVIATRPAGDGNDFDELRANLGELSIVVQEVGIRLRDALQAS